MSSALSKQLGKYDMYSMIAGMVFVFQVSTAEFRGLVLVERSCLWYLQACKKQQKRETKLTKKHVDASKLKLLLSVKWSNEDRKKGFDKMGGLTLQQKGVQFTLITCLCSLNLNCQNAVSSHKLFSSHSCGFFWLSKFVRVTDQSRLVLTFCFSNSLLAFQLLLVLLLAMPEALSGSAAVDLPVLSSLLSLPFYLLCLLLASVHVLVCTSTESSCYFCSLSWGLVFVAIAFSSAMFCILINITARRLLLGPKIHGKVSQT